MSKLTAILALEDGTVFRGRPFGALAQRAGEAVFNTSMTGYQEILTDPSYRGQIVAMTYPLIGNYGVNPEDVESQRPQVEGFVIRELSRVASNWRAQGRLEDYLAAHGVPGIEGVDTRALTRRLRVGGAMKAFLSTEEMDDQEAIARARASRGMVGADYVQEATCAEAYQWDPEGVASRQWSGRELPSLPAPRFRVVAFDYGIKLNILRRMRQRGLDVTVVPAATPAAEVLRRRPDGVFLSNGPGDPAACTYTFPIIAELLGRLPLFGICLGHQLLSLALGGKTFKLKFGHRGANQPVLNTQTGKVEITSQNHGFAVVPDSLPPEVEITHVNLNDRTVEGLRHRAYPAYSVQYHPEASPGPHDADYLFARFVALLERAGEGGADPAALFGRSG